MPLILPHGFFGRSGSNYVPASLKFSGGGFLQRTNSFGSPTNARRLTISFWVKRTGSVSSIGGVLFCGSESGSGSSYDFTGASYYPVGENPEVVGFERYSSNDEWFNIRVYSLPLNQWRHLVYRLDTTTTASNRIRIYGNGSLLSVFESQPPPFNAVHSLFASGSILSVGNAYDIETETPLGFPGKFAFIEVVDGQSLAPSAFAESRGGAWTRIPYIGSFGNKGFKLDGSTGVVGQDVSGNGWHFSTTLGPVTLDYNDLPPYVS